MCFIILGHGLNVAIAFTAAFLLLARADKMNEAYGPDAPGRRILACLYGAIATLSSCALIVFFGFGRKDILIAITLVLFPLQILYKIATLPVVGWKNPVVKANILIALFLIFSLFFEVRFF